MKKKLDKDVTLIVPTRTSMSQRAKPALLVIGNTTINLDDLTPSLQRLLPKAFIHASLKEWLPFITAVK